MADHLLHPNTYRRLEEDYAEFKVSNAINKCKLIIRKAQMFKQIEDHEYTYLMRGLNQNQRIARFYCIPKVHKSPWATRPVTSTCGTPLSIISTFLDYKLQPFLQFMPTHIRDSFDLKQKLEKLGKLPDNARLFTADAVSMYTNIDTPHGLEIIKKWIVSLKLERKIEEDFPTEFIMDLLTLVMTENVFQFGNTYWIQLVGTAMGTPIAVTYANLYSGWKERDALIPKFRQNLLHISRFVDDLFGIWIPSSNDPENLQFEHFKEELNDYKPGILKWEVEKLCEKVNFLDLTIEVTKERTLTFKTYQKELNLFLYLPSHSAHPPGTLKGLVHGALDRYWKQNTHLGDYQAAAMKLYNNLRRRGYDDDTLTAEFRTAAENIDRKRHKHKPTPQLTTENSIFFHREYHPSDLTRKEIQKAIEENLDVRNDKELQSLGIKRSTIAYSRPKNIKDVLCPTTLHQTTRINARTYLPPQNETGQHS